MRAATARQDRLVRLIGTARRQDQQFRAQLLGGRNRPRRRANRVAADRRPLPFGLNGLVSALVMKEDPWHAGHDPDGGWKPGRLARRGRFQQPGAVNRGRLRLPRGSGQREERTALQDPCADAVILISGLVSHLHKLYGLVAPR